MSTSFPKSRQKRRRPSSESNKSFVKNVTSRVSGLLPATITKWFSSPSSSNTNGSATVADPADSSTEDEAPESPTHLPTKRMRYTSPGNLHLLSPVETKSTSTNTEPIHGSLYTVFSPISKSDMQRDNNHRSTPINSPNDDTSEESIQDSSFFKPEHSLSVTDSTNTNKRKSLFGTLQEDSYKKERSTGSGSGRDPYFKPSLLSSPFYVGRTRYGGAASSYITSPSIQHRRINVSNESSNNESVIMSHSTRRILDLLEHYSSPLSEARRIPQIKRYPEKPNLNNSMQQSVNPYILKPYSYKTQELYVPSFANILTIKRKSRLMDSTNAARQIIASHSSSSPEFSSYANNVPESHTLEDASGDIFTTKMKSRLTRINRGRNTEMEDNSIETVNLPNVVLQIDKDNLPKFTFGPAPTFQSSSIQTPVIITPEALKRSAEIEKSEVSNFKDDEIDKQVLTDKNNDNFKFSTPVPVSVETVTVTKSQIQFGSPERNVDKVEEIKNSVDQLKSHNIRVIKFDKLLVPPQKSSDWKCLDCWVMNKSDVNKCVCCCGKKPVEIDENPKKCVVCNICIAQSPRDKCNDCEKKTNNVDKPFVIKETTSKWKCDICWVDNTESAEKCVCCGGKNPKINTEMSRINFVDKDSPKHTEIKGKETFDSAYKNITKTQNEKWECSICLVRNESSRSSCSCCDAGKPGSVSDSAPKFNFHQPSEITFKFGIQPKFQAIDIEECSMGEESETNNNILPKTSFNFGIPAKKLENVSEISVDKPAEAPKLNFGAKVDPVPPVSNSIFAISDKVTETNNNTEEKEKLQEVPQMFIRPKSDELPKNDLGLFNKPVTSHVPGMPALIPMHLSQSSVIKKDSPFSTTSAISATNSDRKTQNNFSFPPGNLFATEATATTEVASVLTTSLSMSGPATCTMSLFQKPKLVTTTASSFFQKTESVPKLGASLFPRTETITTSSVSMSTVQPVFSFGVGAAATQQPPSEKAFNFNFSSNTTESAPGFTPAFGVSTDNQNSSITFNLPSNSIIGGNSLSGGNQPNNTTQLNTVNPLTTGNSLSTSSAPSLFGATIQTENMWATGSNNIFATNTTSNPVQQLPSTFTFGSASSFTANNSGFGNTPQQVQQTQPTQNVFGIANPTNTSQPSMFGNPLQNQSAPNIFGAPQVQNNPMLMGMFGAPNPSAVPSFGIPNQPTAPFEPTPIAPSPAPTAFNFGGQQSTGVFGFGQQPQQPGPAGGQADPQSQVVAQHPSMYNFGTPVMSGPQMQFTIGSAPNANTAGRRLRKATRRTQR